MREEANILLDDIIKQDLERIETMEIGSQEREKAISDVEKLINLDIHDYEVKTKAYKDEDSVKTETTKMWVDCICRGAAIAASILVPFVAIYADRNGWFISNVGLRMSPKTPR